MNRVRIAVGDVGNCGGGDRSIGSGGAHVELLTCGGSINKSLILSVVGVALGRNGSGKLKSTLGGVTVSGIHSDVGLSLTVHEVKSVRAFNALNSLKVNVDCISSTCICEVPRILSALVVNVDVTVEEYVSSLVAVEETKLVSSAYLGKINNAELSLRSGLTTGKYDVIESTLHKLVGFLVVLEHLSGYGKSSANNESVVGKLVTENGLVLKTCYYDSGVAIAIKLGNSTGDNEGTAYGLAISKAVYLLDNLSGIGDGLGLCVRSKSICIRSGHELNYKLRNAGVLSGNVSSLRNADGLVGVVSTNTVRSTINSGLPRVGLSNVVEYSSILGRETNVLGNLTVVVYTLSVNVVLNTVDNGVPLVAVAVLLYVEVSSLGCIVSGLDVLVILLVGSSSIELLAKVNLNHVKLVSCALNGSRGDTGRIDNRKSLVEGELYSCTLSVGNSSGKNVSNLCIVLRGEVNGPEVSLVALLDGDSIVINSPGNCERGTIDNNLSYEVIVNYRCCSAILVDVEEVGLRLVEGRTGYFIVIAATNKALDHVATGEGAKSESDNEKKCQNLFHLFSPLFNLIWETKIISA